MGLLPRSSPNSRSNSYQDFDCLFGHSHDRHHLLDPTPINGQKHASGQPNGPTTKDPSLRIPRDICRGWRGLSHRSIDLLVHHKHLVNGATVLDHQK